MNFVWTEAQHKRRKLSNPRSLNRLGTLQSLPYEIRQHIFMIVLVDSIDEHYKAIHKYDQALIKSKCIDCKNLERLELTFQRRGDHCCCRLSNQKPGFASVFNLASYCVFRPGMKAGSLNIRSASRSIQAEFDYMFLTRSTFAFHCPTALRVFLDHLTPLQQTQLRCIKLSMFKSWFWCCSDSRRDRWLYQCRTLPPTLTSVEFVMPYRLKYIYECWMHGSMREGDTTLEDVAGVLRIHCMEVVRAVPRARISYRGQSVLDIVKCDNRPLGLALIVRDSLSREERDVLDALICEVESWRRVWRDEGCKLHRHAITR